MVGKNILNRDYDIPKAPMILMNLNVVNILYSGPREIVPLQRMTHAKDTISPTV